MAPSIPIIIGVGDVKNRSTTAKEPATLILEAIRLAIHDAGSSSASALQASIDSIDVVRTWTWPYPDLPGLVARELGVQDGLKWKAYSEHGGDKPGRMFDAACKRIASGEVKVAVLTGGEALASLSACAAAGQLPPPGWTTPEQAVDSVFTPTGRDLGDTDLGAIHQIGAPIHVYPLYENAFRAHRGQSVKANHEESAKLYAEFSQVAAKQAYAWNAGRADSEEVIATVGKKNRMICSPYPLLMNAFNTVNLASAVILTTTRIATSLNIPPSKWIYPLGGAGTRDSDAFWERPDFYSSPSISRSIDAALRLSDTSKEDIDLYDIYSCFPIVPKLAAMHLGLPITGGEKALTLLGGLTSFGGAGNNYSMHALTEMTRQLRDGKGRKGLVLCNGGVLSYQYVVILSNEPRKRGEYPQENPLPSQITDVHVPEVMLEAEGEAVVETYTVEFKRDGSPLRGHIVGRLKSNDKRFLANHGDDSTLRQMAEGTGEIVGRSGWLRQDSAKKGRGLFTFDEPAKL
ncbi:acetyl-CoA acetyltransferase [Dothidotthia symphoricarpi CBS 119687]|uniref:Acetyl-CoA acetyltransferase n=1 Tax=Dothidotthia symphoricarpi CBS 119687 TaxID=1392245 RepID=A0A6A6AP14_9PLEO|nr:acetyl-CoA acetyltransferase [Dothidotthia symphoricarpi CBS 119687]KAF2132888.1 acetyl-CoA acetyltransferase [Dothidotthia symphoricarpi CBS 119687]